MTSRWLDQSSPYIAEAADYYAHTVPESIQAMLDTVPRLSREELSVRNLELHADIQTGSTTAEFEMTHLNLRIVRRVMYGPPGKMQPQNVASTDRLRDVREWGDMTEEDLWQESVIGLQTACRTWDPEKGKVHHSC